MPEQFKPKNIGIKNCDKPVEGIPHPDFDYIHRTTTGDEEYPEDACARYLQVNANFDNLNVTANIDAGGTVTAPTFQGAINVQSWKGFDIKHPNKENHRLRHICLEGPEAGVYHRGKGKGKVIELPEYWQGLVDEESITVHLTPIGRPYVLYVEEIRDNKIYVNTNFELSGVDIVYYYIINASRIDGEPLIIEYEGETPADYPADPTQFSISGYDYGVDRES